MSGPVLRIAALLPAIVFAWSALAKVLAWSRWTAALEGYRFGTWSRPIAYAAPVAEVAVAALLLSGQSKPGAAGALMLLALFSAAILRARLATGDRLPCGCFGGTDERDYRLMLARNLLLAVCAAIVLVGERELAIFDGARFPEGAEIVPAIVTVVGVVAVLWIGTSLSRSLRGSGRSR